MPITSSEPAEPQRGLQGDLKRAKSGTFASAAELREFVQNLKGKSPQEVLGAVANSGLAQGVGLATIGTAVMFAIFTVGPYMLYGKPKPPAVTKATAAAEPAANTPAAATSATEKAAAPSKDAASNAQQTLDKMGESETKKADPKVNPLDNLDDLLDTKK